MKKVMTTFLCIFILGCSSPVRQDSAVPGKALVLAGPPRISGRNLVVRHVNSRIESLDGKSVTAAKHGHQRLFIDPGNHVLVAACDPPTLVDREVVFDVVFQAAKVYRLEARSVFGVCKIALNSTKT